MQTVVRMSSNGQARERERWATIGGRRCCERLLNQLVDHDGQTQSSPRSERNTTLSACSALSALNVISIAFSEREAHAQLNVAAIVALRRDAPEARSCRIGVTQAPGERVCLGARLIPGGKPQIGMVGEIEELCPELQLARAAHAEVLEQRNIPL